MEKILINVGNTHTYFATMDCSVFMRAETKDIMASARHAEFEQAFCACVVPSAAEKLKAEFGGRIHFLSSENISTIDLSEVNASTTGADRLANLLAADKNFPGEPVLILDCGTCVTGELLAERSFKGGFIHPGRRIQRLALTDHTGALPSTMLTNFPPRLIGVDTDSSILSGIDNVSYLGIQSIIHKLKDEYPGLKVVLTGGDAGFYREIVDDAVEEPDFTLQGLAVFASSFA